MENQNLKIRLSQISKYIIGCLFFTLILIQVYQGWLSSANNRLVKSLKIQSTEEIGPGFLIRSHDNPAVYYIGRDLKRYTFPDEGTYFSWFRDFSQVHFVDQETLDSFALGSVVLARPGVRPIKPSNDSRVYAVEPDGVLHWIPNEEIFHALGYSFDKLTIISDAFWTLYQIGNDATVPQEGGFIQDDASGNLYYLHNGVKRLASLQAMQANHYFPHHLLHLSDGSRLADFPEGELITGYEEEIAGLPDGRRTRQMHLLPPANFLASGEVGRVQLTWNTVSGAVNYLVYRSLEAPITNLQDPSVVIIANLVGNVTSYSDNNLADETTYYYAIRARNDNNLFSALTLASAITLAVNSQDATPPNPPTNFSASGGQQQITLNWTISSSSDVNLQQIYRSLSPISNVNGNGVNLINQLSSNNNTYLDTGLNASTTYYYALRARDAAGNFSSIVTASALTLVGTAPNPPTNFTATATGQTTINLSWILSNSSGIQNQYLYRSTSPITDPNGAGVTLIGTLSATTILYADFGLTPGTTYYYALRVRNASNVYSSLATVSATTQGQQPPAPNPPTNFTATATGQTTINLIWTLSNSSGIQNQYLYRSLSAITDPNGAGVTLIATLLASPNSYSDVGLTAGTTYYYAIRVRNASNQYSVLANASAVTDSADSIAQLDRVLQIPEYPDNIVPDGLQWSMDTLAMAASLGINKFMVPTRYYQGLNDLDPNYGPQACINHVGRFCTPYHQFLSYADTLETPDGRPVEIVFLSAKVTKTPMAGSNAQLKGAIRLQQMGETPYNFLPRLSQTSGTLPPEGQGETRAFITVSFSDALERDRLLRLTTNISGDAVHVRWYPSSWGTAKFRDTPGNYQEGLGTKTWDFPNPTVGGNNQYLILIMNRGTVPLTWEIQGLEEIAPNPSEIRNQDANYFEWLGSSQPFNNYGYNHPRYALDETRTRFINTMNAVWNEYSSHPSLVGLMGNGDEPHAMFWMEEDLNRFQNAGHELAEFEKAVAAGQYAFTQYPFMLFGDPRDPTHNGISTGVYSSNMAGGGFSDMASRFNGSEPIDWLLWSDIHSTNGISSFTSQGSNVYLMDSLYDPNVVEDFGEWVTAANGLPEAEKEHIKGWYYYVETREYVTQASLEEVINATPAQL